MRTMLNRHRPHDLPSVSNWDIDPEEIPSDPEWMDYAACRYMDTNIFFPPTKGLKAAKAICATCLVKAKCLEYALVNRQKGGIWGGESERARKRLLALRKT